MHTDPKDEGVLDFLKGSLGKGVIGRGQATEVRFLSIIVVVVVVVVVVVKLL